MRNARVGAMPNPSGNNTSTRRGNRVEEAKAGGRKGITIEDLKNQTAERLAKQHQSRQRKHIRSTCTEQPKVSHVETDVPSKPQTAPTPQPHHAPIRTSNSAHGLMPQTFQHVTSFESEFSASSQASIDVSAHTLASGPNTPNRSTHASMHHRQNDFYSGHQSAHKNHEQKSHNRSHHKKSPYVPLKVQKVSKLPQTLSHGLTVQELKEMTRARLASEATEESGSVGVNDADHQYNPRQRVYSHEGNNSEAVPRQRFDSADSFRSAPSSYAPQPSSNFRNPFVKSRSSSRLNHPGISTFGSLDAGDNASVNSFVSGLGTESFVGSDASGFYTAAPSTRDLGRSVSFPVGESHGESENDQYGHYMASASFETGSRRHAASGLPSPGLSNLMEDKPFHSDIDIGASFSGEGQRFEFGGLPASPAVHNSSFSEEALSDLLHKRRPITPSTARSQTFSDSHTTNDEIPFPIPDLKDGILGRQTSRGGELSKTVAESVLGSSPLLNQGEFLKENPSFFKEDGQDASNPWEESDDSGFSKLQTDLNKLLLSESNRNVGNSLFSSFRSKSSAKKESDWTSLAGDALTPRDASNITTPECFDDDAGVAFTASVSTDESPPNASPAKIVNKKRNTSRWKFM